MEWIDPAWGLPGLFLVAFLAATLLPLGSELWVAAMATGPVDWPWVLVVATAGNTLGAVLNYGIGRWGAQLWPRRAADPRSRSARIRAGVERYGAWAGLLCWLPVVGDPLAVALGVGRTAFWPTVLTMALGKAARYAVLIAVVRGLW